MKKIIEIYKKCCLCQRAALQEDGEICVFHEESFLPILVHHLLYQRNCRCCGIQFSEANNMGEFECQNKTRHHWCTDLGDNTTIELPELFLKLFISKRKKPTKIKIELTKHNIFNYDCKNKIYKIARTEAILNGIKKSSVYKTKYKKNLDKKFTVKKKQ